MMTLNTEKAALLLRCSDVKRWTIIPVSREQTVAEHHYRVWILSLCLYDHLMGGIPHNSFEREAVGLWALVHDADEIWTGDLPSPIKRQFEIASPGILKKVKEQVLGEHLPQVLEILRGIEGTRSAALVKLAEAVEAVIFYGRYGVGGASTRDEVFNYLDGQVETALSTLVTHGHRYDQMVEWMNQVKRLV